MAIIIYRRVSTDDQVESGAGLAAQLNACKAYAERSGAVITAVFTDEGISGAKSLEQRPALLDAVGELSKGDVLLVAKRDRLGRDPLVVAMIEASVNRKGARIVSAAGEGTEGDDPSNILMRRLIDAFSEYERLIIGHRTKAAMQAMKRKGKRVGSVPYGYRLSADGIHLEEIQAEQEVISQARRLHQVGMGLSGIARHLNARGFVSRSGKVFEATQIKRMIAA